MTTYPFDLRHKDRRSRGMPKVSSQNGNYCITVMTLVHISPIGCAAQKPQNEMM